MSNPPNGILFYDARAKPLSVTGAIQPGAYYQFYLTGTTTPANVYSDGALSSILSQTPGTGGTTAASDGRLVPIYMNPAIVYRYRLYSAGAVLLEDIDPYLPSPPVGQLPGTATNDSAATGNVGEYSESVIISSNAISISSGTPLNVTSLSLTAGDWDVWGTAAFLPAGTTTVTQLAAGIGVTSATLGDFSKGNAQKIFASFAPGNNVISQVVPPQRLTFGSTTFTYLVAKATFATSTMTVYGGLFARRRR